MKIEVVPAGWRGLLAVAAVLAGGCSDCPVPSDAATVAIDAPAAVRTEDLRILTWNVWLMPPFTFQSPRNEKRAAAIATELLGLHFDILCLEKVFDARARRVLEAALRERYPYRYGPANCKGGMGQTSGVWVLSRIPLTFEGEIRYRDCAGFDCFSRKGAVFLSGSFRGQPFQLLATHLQGGAEPADLPRMQPIRQKQIAQIDTELVRRLGKPDVPVFLCGDFVTPRYDEGSPGTETSGYRHLLDRFDARNGEEHRITLDERRDHNDLGLRNGTRTGELDYVLVISNGAVLRTTWTRHILQRSGWDGTKGRKDLSYRYAVGLTVQFPSGADAVKEVK